MAGAIDIGLDDLYRVYNPETVRSIFCDDGSGRPSNRLEEAIAIARRLGDAQLLKAWNLAQIETLIVEDAAIRALMCRLIIAEGGQGKLEWSGDPTQNPFDLLEKKVLAQLGAIALGQLRSAGESVAGANPNIAGDVSTTCPKRMFAPTREQPRRRGY
jgi:hypothetical protein